MNYIRSNKSESGQMLLLGLVVVCGGFLVIAFFLGVILQDEWAMKLIAFLKTVFH